MKILITGPNGFIGRNLSAHLLVLGDTNSALSVISAKRLKIPIFHMEEDCPDHSKLHQDHQSKRMAKGFQMRCGRRSAGRRMK